ncbi:hypothetical protein, partial [Streptomyces lavendulae]
MTARTADSQAGHRTGGDCEALTRATGTACITELPRRAVPEPGDGHLDDSLLTKQRRGGPSYGARNPPESEAQQCGPPPGEGGGPRSLLLSPPRYGAGVNS